MILEGALTRTLNLAVNTVFVEVVMCATFVTYTLVGGELTVRKVFTFLALLNLCRQTVTVLFVRGLFYLNEATVAFRRIQVSGSDDIGIEGEDFFITGLIGTG